MQVPYNYLPFQFANPKPFLEDWKRLISSSEFTLGPFVEAFEQKFAAFVGARYCISTNTGTDALILALKAAGVRPGDEVITVCNTFYATVGAISAVGAKPVFVDCDDRYQIDVRQIPGAITSKTRAILPVHWGGCLPDIERVAEIANAAGIPIVEDACPATGASVNGRHAGSFGAVGAFSMHPLKPLNVMGDGGMVVTDDFSLAEWMRKYRNHGMVDRDHIDFWGVNMRLQPFQALVASRVPDTVNDLVRIRNRNARQLDAAFEQLADFVQVPKRPAGHVETYQLYMARFVRRDELLRFLIDRGIEAKVHYPLPLHLQKAAASLGHERGDFPESEKQADELVTIPAHQYVTPEQIDYVIRTVRAFYNC